MKDYLKLNNEVLNTYSLTGIIDREKDKEATRNFFFDEINRKTMFFHTLEEKINYLTREGYYETDFLEKYSFSFIKKIFKTAYDYKFRFSTFMSASKFYSGYALKTRDGENYLERYEDRMAIVALYLAQGKRKDAEKWIHYLMRSYQPATPTFINVGKKARGEFVSCFKIAMDDSMNSIAHNLGNALQLSKLGGGVGIALTDLRCAKDPIKEIQNRASGVMPVAKLLENSFSYANQLGQRAGSGVIWLNIFHGDIEDFLSAKKPNADEKVRLSTMSTGIILPDIFFELMRQDKDIVLFSPYDIQKEYGKRMSEISMTEMYYNLLDNPNIRKLKRINARKLYTEVKKSQIESGYPFEMFDDNVNKAHPLKKIGRVKISNLCTEIMQLMETSFINDYDEVDVIGLDVSCNLGSLDIHNSVKENSFEDLIDSAMRMLVAVSDMTNISNVPAVARANRKMRSVGLGVMNLHGHLVSQGIMYGSKEANEFIDVFFTALNYYSIKASMLMAKERKETFYRFEESDYASGEYFIPYLKKEIGEISETAKTALGNVPIITIDMWKELAEGVKQYGMLNSYRIAIAPTGSISYSRGCSASMSPITERVEVRDYADSRTIYPMPFLNNDNKDLYVEAYDMDMYKMIDSYAIAQKHVDQAISMTLYIKDNWDTEQLAKLYIYAWLKGIKSVYYVRQRMQTLEECVSCSI
ncbi:class 1b ribonucleoside-diphosphate reductase subunit alpha [Lysinibacillus xylanilyticus]|uniref:class 1b ribonucleoside-diphosphate reductase subunit alpha n=1 Tax=Lysinibacillus xylanilyticus TaxID=582475 RepID=UPI00380D680B